MTKTIDFYETFVKQPKKKPIEFHKMLNSLAQIKPTTLKPSDFDVVVSITRNYNWTNPNTNTETFDVILAYNVKNPSEATIFLGLWNDGVVE